MKRKMDDKGHMHVTEAVVVVLLILATIYFLTSSISTPTVKYSTSLYQMETTGEDALRSADQMINPWGISMLSNSTLNAVDSGAFDEDDELIEHLDEIFTKKISYRIMIDNTVYYEKSNPGNSTSSVHRIIVDRDTGNIYDFQLLMWHKL